MGNNNCIEQKLIFKAYQRSLLRNLIRVREAIATGNRYQATMMIEELIHDTNCALTDHLD